MTNVLSTNHFELSTKHQANIAAALAHRLDMARATQNTQLLTLLEQEQQQLGQIAPTQRTSRLISWYAVFWHRLTSAIAHRSKLSIEKVMGDSGMIFWRAYDPTTGETLYAETETEVVDWIEANYRGK